MTKDEEAKKLADELSNARRWMEIAVLAVALAAIVGAVYLMRWVGWW